MRVELASCARPDEPEPHLWLVVESSDDLLGGLKENLRRRVELILARRGRHVDSLADDPLLCDLPDGRLCCLSVVKQATPFAVLEALRRAATLLLRESPDKVRVIVVAMQTQRRLALVRHATRVLLINSIDVGASRDTPAKRPLTYIETDPALPEEAARVEVALAEGNALVRWLAAMPSNLLGPAAYVAFCQALAQEVGLECRVYASAELAGMGAGAFTAVVQGSEDSAAAIVQLRHAGRGNLPVAALVGKGVCFDTGGYQVKTADEMTGMHEDMTGSAVTLALAVIAVRLDWPLPLEAWLAIGENRIGPKAYLPQQVITSLDGTSIEVVHTDAEGRLMLADAITLAKKASEPDLLVDIATLTGGAVQAFGTRVTAAASNDLRLVQAADTAAEFSGERIGWLAMPPDYDADLRSERADLCNAPRKATGGKAVLAARFLSRFVGDTPWLHLDLSAWKHEGGLGAVGSDLTGWGVYFGAEFLQRWLSDWRPPKSEGRQHGQGMSNVASRPRSAGSIDGGVDSP